MNSVWIYSLVSIFIVSLISLVGLITISLKIEFIKKSLYFLVSFAAGALLGDVFIHLLPELALENGFSLSTSINILSGLLTFFILEKIICWRHCHVPTSKNHPHTLGTMNLIGDSLHNFTDGMIIGASYLVSLPIGLATSLAVILHEIPQEIGDFSVLIFAGLSKPKALFYNFLTALFAFLGCFLVLKIGIINKTFNQFLISFTAGGFLYIAASDLIPELKKEEGLKKSLLQFVSLLAGIYIMSLIK